jgi:hypothetical protein
MKRLKEFMLSDQFTLNTIVSVDELTQHDLLYVSHQLQVGSAVRLEIAGTNVVGDLRYKAYFQKYLLGYVTIGGPVKSIYEGIDSLECEIINLKSQKFLPIRAIDLNLQATKMRLVS